MMAGAPAPQDMPPGELAATAARISSREALAVARSQFDCALGANAEAVAAKLVEMALAGNVPAMLVVARTIVPPAKFDNSKINLDVGALETAADLDRARRRLAAAMPRHFVVIAPNLTVFERLKEDFRPEGGGPDIFMKDPLIPPEWRGDWNFSVVLQDEASGASTGGVLYLTNIHRLFEAREGRSREPETYSWAGPAVSKAKALDTGEELRDRITAHKRVMVLNDEAHHVWDPGSAWNQAIRWLHDTLRSRGGEGLTAQLDFSATPKNDTGVLFPHIVCDTPLGEAVDAGIVKTPVIGRSGQIIEQAHDDAAYRYEAHLRLGYERWKRSRDEWGKSGKKPLLFVMCENTDAADQITGRLNSDPVFKDLNGKAINLHTNLKGKFKKQKIDGKTVEVFVEDEKAISDDDLKAIRKISRELDNNTSPYLCIVSVLMLREGWDGRH